MRLLSLALRNFKGQRDFTLSLDGADASVFGDNGVGKTTLADAWHWLLFGKDSQGRAAFEIKTLDREGKALSRHEHSVEARLETASGALTLRRTLTEDWGEIKSSGFDTFKGHKTEYWINTVPSRMGEYDARVAELLPKATGKGRSAAEAERLFRVLTDPFFLVEGMKWQDRRALLTDAFGDVSDEDVIAATPELAELPKILGSLRIDDFRKIAQASATKIKADKDGIPGRIDEADRALPSIVPGDWEATLATARVALTEAQNLRATVVAGGAEADRTKRLREVEGETIQIVNRLRSQPDPAREAAIARRRELDVRRQEAADAHTSLQRRIQEADADLTKMGRVREKLLADHKAEKDREIASPDVCPSCLQALPEESRAAALAAHNEAKAKRLGEIVEAGRELRRRIDALSAELEGWRTEAAASAATIVRLNAERAAHVLPEPTPIVPTDDPAYAALVTEQEGLNREIAQLQTDSTSALAEIDEEIREAQAKVDEASRNIQLAELREKGLARKRQLNDEEKRLATELERHRRHLHLCDEFTRAKVAMLTDRINSCFDVARFRLFKNQINGGLEECCDVTKDGVPYGSLNHGSRVEVGLDVVDALAAHHGFAPPIFLDNAESVTRLRPTAGQQVRLVVSEPDKSLRVVVAAGGRTAGTRELQEALL